MGKYQRLPKERLTGPLHSMASSNGLAIPFGDKKLILIAGQMAIDSEDKAQCEDMPGEQTEYIFRNIHSILRESGATLDDIVRVVIYVTDMSYLSEVSNIRDRYISFAKPVCTIIGVNELAVKGCKVEIEVTAIA